MNTRCCCGQPLHDGPCYEVSAIDALDAYIWEKLFAMTKDQRRKIVAKTRTEGVLLCAKCKEADNVDSR